ncbi:MAG: hypothetical protein IH610_13910 [Deltaproteobacteria bacterium]|nr:hypothetical protein [Deltaproteobacteria bacterium]
MFRCLVAGAAIVAASAFSDLARAEVNINVNLGPPPIVVAAPPAVVMIPQTQVYFVPDPHVEVFFYGGYWWSPRGEQWYRAKAYDGPWGVIEHRRVPQAVIYVPRDYRARYEHEHHVPYGQWKKEHSRWDKQNKKSHKKWEKEREKEWKESQKGHGKEKKHGDHGVDGGGNHGKSGR